MKSISNILIFFVVLFSVSCLEPTDMLTVINPDGSCYREFSENADSAFLMGDTTSRFNPFPVEIDSTWKIAWTYKNSGLRTDFPFKKTTYDSIYNSSIPEGKLVGKKSKNDVLVFARRNYKSVEDMDSTFNLKQSNGWS
jgi:hypothetical protein